MNEKELEKFIITFKNNYHNFSKLQLLQLHALLSDNRPEVGRLIMMSDRTVDDFAYYGDDVYLKELWKTEFDPRFWNYEKYVEKGVKK